MKKTFLAILLFFVCFPSFSQAPDLAMRTINGNLKPSDFVDDGKYVVNVDTLKWETEFLSGEYTIFESKEQIITKLKNVFINFHHKKIEYFIESIDNPLYYPSKKHWYMIIENYRIDWGFSKKDSNKFESVTLVKFKTEN